MGAPKYRLPFGDETLLCRICRIVAETAHPVAVVGAAKQDLSLLPEGVVVVRDSIPDQGPLQAIADGLCRLVSVDNDPSPSKPLPSIVFVSSCDTPLLTSDVIRYLFQQLLSSDAAVVVCDGPLTNPLCAVYRIGPCLTAARQLLDSGERRLVPLVHQLQARRIPSDALRQVDPQLNCLLNCNTPELLHEALRRAGKSTDRAPRHFPSATRVDHGPLTDKGGHSQ
jgi:molybdopterin-guanine dinucleotide biosynthesis protein A